MKTPTNTQTSSKRTSSGLGPADLRGTTGEALASQRGANQPPSANRPNHSKTSHTNEKTNATHTHTHTHTRTRSRGAEYRSGVDWSGVDRSGGGDQNHPQNKQTTKNTVNKKTRKQKTSYSNRRSSSCSLTGRPDRIPSAPEAGCTRSGKNGRRRVSASRRRRRSSSLRTWIGVEWRSEGERTERSGVEARTGTRVPHMYTLNRYSRKGCGVKHKMIEKIAWYWMETHTHHRAIALVPQFFMKTAIMKTAIFRLS